MRNCLRMHRYAANDIKRLHAMVCWSHAAYKLHDLEDLYLPTKQSQVRQDSFWYEQSICLRRNATLQELKLMRNQLQLSKTEVTLK